MAKKIDLDRIVVNISNLNSQRQHLLNTVSLLENQLKFYMGMPIQTPVFIPDIEMKEIMPQALLMNNSVPVENRLEYRLFMRPVTQAKA